jgi:hypothetical protein
MTTLLDGTVIDESRDAYHYFTPDQCLQYYLRPRIVKYITIHHWGSLGQKFYDVVNFLCTRRDSNPTSAHAVIMAGFASSIINPDNVAFHSGSAVGNAESIGLECRPEATDEDYITVAAYIAYLRSLYGDVPLRKHSDWYATACPGNWDLVRLDKLAREIAANGVEDEVALSPNFEENVRASLKSLHDKEDALVAKYGKFDGQVREALDIIRNEQAAQRVLLTADRGLSKEELLDAIQKAVLKVQVSVETTNGSNPA